MWYIQHLALIKLHDAINREPDSVKARKLFEQFKAATQDATTSAYTTIVNTLEANMAVKPQKETPTKDMEQDNKGMKQKLKPVHNNPEQAGKFTTKLKTAVDLFESHIHTYDRYETKKAYPEFVETYLKLLSMAEDYYSFAKASVVLDIIPDKMAKLLRVEIACEKEEQEKCPDPCTSADNILSRHQMLNKLAALSNFKWT